MILTLDVENTVVKRNGKMHLDPFEPDNTLVMVGMLDDHSNETIVTFDHSEQQPTTDGRQIVQDALDATHLLVAHNAPHDLLWLWESGFTYDGNVYDTMLGEYVLQRGQKQPLSLEACAERYELDTQKQDTLKEYFKNGYSTRDIPHDELAEYLSHDLHATQQLYNVLQTSYEGCKSLIPTIELTNQLAIHLARIYQRGFQVDMDALMEVRDEFEQERNVLMIALEEQARDLMGDRPINLNSPEQLSWVIYSRKPHDKKMWADLFDDRMSDSEYRSNVTAYSQKLYKQKAHQCRPCKGGGQVWKQKKDGTPYAKSNKCGTCGGSGYTFSDVIKDVAGLRFTPPNAKWVSANGFGTGKDNLVFLEGIARSKGMKIAETFLQNVRRLSAVETYLSSFVEGIATHVKTDGKLHVRLLQHRTGTGRLSGADPNMQNMPRGGTFPVKKVFISRWHGGKIMEADFAQLEFRVAAFLSQDMTAIDEVTTGFDVHSYTAQVISDAGQPMSRQEAKAHTFAPLYGASGFGRSQAEAAYYKQFTKKYSGIAKWHEALAKEALSTSKITTPSGREFSFPDVQRRRFGGVTFFTQIKNYPVQSFATADIVPISLIYIDKLLTANKLHSCVVNTVHDSIVIDVHPDEEDRVLQIIKAANDKLIPIVNRKWSLDFNIPLLLEAKMGPNWLDTKDVV
jgi:DNA polymerase I-like protein with 3'-5' exonuclease and polymerase domains|tara:strand:+ start:555 stop:2600 length:2046 start_codon:yes stop_codon:yes gene_type:complete